MRNDKSLKLGVEQKALKQTSGVGLPAQAYAVTHLPCPCIRAQASNKHQFITQIQQGQAAALTGRHIRLLKQVLERPGGAFGVQLKTLPATTRSQPQRAPQELRAVQTRAATGFKHQPPMPGGYRYLGFTLPVQNNVFWRLCRERCGLCRPARHQPARTALKHQTAKRQ